VVRETFQQLVAYPDLDGTGATVMFDLDFLLVPNGTVPESQWAALGTNLTHVGWAKVNSRGQICGMKALFQRLGISDLARSPYANPWANMTQQLGTIEEICGLTNFTCVGANQQYPDIPTCIAAYTEVYDDGWERADQQDVGCFNLHQILTFSRPDIHCPHTNANATISVVCAPHSQESFYSTDALLHC
jgi:hypothetical protein